MATPPRPAPMENRLFGAVMFWTVATTTLAWLPLVRIIGRAEGYTWGIGGLRGAGTSGPFWIFVLLTAYAVFLLFTASRGPRVVFRPMLILWHLAFTGVVVGGIAGGGSGATIQGQGLRFEFPLWVLAIPCLIFTGLAVAWAVRDWRDGAKPVVPAWSAANSRRLAVSVLLLVLALGFFRAGTNYNWVTAVAIVITVTHWILLARAFEPLPARASDRLEEP